MYRKIKNILYCSGSRSHRFHRELVRLAGLHNCRIYHLPWAQTSNGTYTGPFSVDGVVSLLDPEPTSLLESATGKIPHVTVHASTLSALGLPAVVLDHRAAGRLVAEHFVSLGFTNFAAFSDPTRSDTFDARFEGFSQVVTTTGFARPPTVSLKRSRYSRYDTMLEACGQELKEMRLPLAIMTANDRAAISLMDACAHCGLSIPAQLAICGFGNDPINCDLAPVPLSSVDTDLERQAREAFNLLLAMLEGNHPDASPIVISPRELVVRQSSGIQAQKDDVVACALAYIHTHAWDHGLTIPEIAMQVDTPPSTFFKVFRRETSRTPLQYITELRIEKAKRMIKETDLQIKDLRPLCGFASDYQMFQAFKRTTGRTPSSFRAQNTPNQRD